MHGDVLVAAMDTAKENSLIRNKVLRQAVISTALSSIFTFKIREDFTVSLLYFLSFTL